MLIHLLGSRRGANGEMLVPVTCLRDVWTFAALSELLWYCRGEDNVKWLQKNDVRFWDKDADKDGYVGMNYGLLTNSGTTSAGTRRNPLWDDIILPLCEGKLDSRNMAVPLMKADTDARVNSCTANIQVRFHFTTWTVRQQDGRNHLGLWYKALPEHPIALITRVACQIITTGRVAGHPEETGMKMIVTQRSSDVVVGLPYGTMSRKTPYALAVCHISVSRDERAKKLVRMG